MGRFFKGLLVFLVLVVLIGLLKKWGSGIALTPKVGVVYLRGTITARTSEEVVSLLREAFERPDIKGIVLRINSPGGAVAPSQEIYSFIMKHRNKKRIYASISTVGASGAYYAASACHKIYADAGSLVGSIGVIFTFADVKELLSKIGVRPYTYKSGKFKDLGSPFRSPTSEEEKVINEILADIHRQFVEDVAKGRSLPVPEVEKIATGRIYTGREALRLKLVDGILDFDAVVDRISRDLGFEKRLDVVILEKKRGFMEKIKAEVLDLIREVKLELAGGVVE